MGWPRHKKTKAIIQAYENGEKLEVISTVFQVHRTNVRKIAKRAGIPGRPPHRIKREMQNDLQRIPT